MKIAITIDVEEDISKYLENSYKGVEKALPRLLDILGEFKITGDFFVTGKVTERYPQLIKRIVEEKHNLGCHSYNHEFLCTQNYEDQLNEISKATDVIKEIVGVTPKMFRAPNFSVNEDTIKVLEKLEYDIDSSILPGRVMKKWRLFTIYDFRNAPREPYNLSREDVRIKGISHIVEIPITENPFNRGYPIGMGFLNYVGLEKTIEAIKEVETDYVTFLIHPWELVDLSQYSSRLPKWALKACSDDFELFRGFIECTLEHYSLSDLRELYDSFLS